MVCSRNVRVSTCNSGYKENCCPSDKNKNMYKNKKLIDVKTKEEKEEVKQCSDCEEVKPVGEFFMQSAKLGTRQTFCKECSKVRKDKLAKKKAKELANKPAGEKKVCRTCSDEKELSEFYVSSRDGTMPDCKECTSARARERKAAKPACRCGEIKSIEEFYSDISKATGKTAACKKCWVRDGVVSRKHQLTYNFNMP